MSFWCLAVSRHIVLLLGSHLKLPTEFAPVCPEARHYYFLCRRMWFCWPIGWYAILHWGQSQVFSWLTGNCLKNKIFTYFTDCHQRNKQHIKYIDIVPVEPCCGLYQNKFTYFRNLSIEEMWKETPLFAFLLRVKEDQYHSHISEQIVETGRNSLALSKGKK